MQNFPINPNKDPDLGFVSPLLQSLPTRGYLADSWLWREREPRILVTGATQWLGRYLLHLLTERELPLSILAVDKENRPEYLGYPRYHRIEYRPIHPSYEDLASVVEEFRPQLIFHPEMIWDPSRTDLEAIYAIQVGQIERVCQAAAVGHVRRIITFSDSSIYGPGESLADEDLEPDPATPLARSFLDAERMVQTFHRPGQLEVYSLRLSLVYGPLIPVGFTPIARLLDCGWLPGIPEPRDRSFSLVHGADVACAAWLLALVEPSSYRIFNIAGCPISLADLLRETAQFIPKGKLLGFSTRLAEIFGIGFQEKMLLPRRFLVWGARLAQETVEFLNQLRFTRKQPLFTPSLLREFLQARPLCGKRLTQVTGWNPQAKLWGMAEAIDYFRRTQWRDLAYAEGISPIDARVTIPLLDGVTAMLAALDRYTPDAAESASLVPVPLLGFSIDLKSLWLLRDRAANFVWLSLFRKERPFALGQVLLDGLSSVAEGVLTLVRYQHHLAGRLFPQDGRARIKWLATQLGSIDQGHLRFSLAVIATSRLLLVLYEMGQRYAPLLQLLPDKRYGFLWGSEIGDIGLVCHVKQGRLTVEFPRQVVDELSRSYYFPRRLSEFKRLARLHFALGVRLETFLADLLSGDLVQEVARKFGEDYLLAETNEYYSFLAKEIAQKPMNRYLFLNSRHRVEFGVAIGQGRADLLDAHYLEMINLLLDHLEDTNPIVDLLQRGSEGRESLLFLKITDVQRLLAEVISPSRIRKMIFKFLEPSTWT